MPNTISSVTSDNKALPSDGTLTATLTAKVSPADADVTVTWTVATDNPGTVDPLTSTTDISGVATTVLSVTDAGDIKVTATTTDDTVGKSVTVSAAAPLFVPTVLNTSIDDGFTLDQYDLNFGVTASVPHYTNAQAGDTVTFCWGDVAQDGFILKDPAKELPYAIDVTTEMSPSCLQDGSYAVYYTVADVAQNLRCSTAETITVNNGGQTTPTLTRPDIPAGADGYINISDANQGVEVTVTYSSMTAGDLITLYWPAVDANGVAIEAASTALQYSVAAGDTSYTFVMDTLLFYPDDMGYEGSVGAYYTVLTEGEEAVQLSQTTSVQIDTVPPGQNH